MEEENNNNNNDNVIEAENSYDMASIIFDKDLDPTQYQGMPVIDAFPPFTPIQTQFMWIIDVIINGFRIHNNIDPSQNLPSLEHFRPDSIPFVQNRCRSVLKLDLTVDTDISCYTAFVDIDPPQQANYVVQFVQPCFVFVFHATSIERCQVYNTHLGIRMTVSFIV